MDIHEVAGRVAGSGEYVLGADATGSHACYLIYGVLAPGEKGAELRPGRGHEEMVLCIEGELRLTGGVILRTGQAVHLHGEETCRAENSGPGRAVYVIAGGHAAGGHGHGTHENAPTPMKDEV